MKFKSESANLIVWDAQKEKALCKFKNNECETDDPYIIERLKGYEVIGNGREEEQDEEEQDEEEQDEEEQDEEEQEDKEQQVEDLRQEAKEKGIKNWHNMRPENLIAKLRGD